jgi:hypothetical protein
MARTTPTVAFNAIEVKGSLIPDSLLDQVARFKAKQQDPRDYGLEKNERLRDQIDAAWVTAKDLWAEYTALKERAGQGVAALHFSLRMLREVFGWTDLQPVAGWQQGDRNYPITHRAFSGTVPLILKGVETGKLDTGLKTFGQDNRSRSPHSCLQECLNADDSSDWGLLCSGDRLRLLHDNPSLVKPAYLGADLEWMIEGDLFDEFAVLWLTLHASRFCHPSDGSCVLDGWKKEAEDTGERILGQLRGGVQMALEQLGNGFLAHPRNQQLRQDLESGLLSPQALQEQLLRLVYRILLLFTAEDRELLFPPSVGNVDPRRQIYREGYSVGRLRELALKRGAYEGSFGDLWELQRLVFHQLSISDSPLGLPGLGGLFALDQCPNLQGCELGNGFLLRAIKAIGWFDAGGTLTRVNYRDLNTEELGSVYEGLLELHPQLEQQGSQWQLSYGGGAGSDRKTTGSYYTPDSLVQELIKSALIPVIEDRLGKANGPAEQEQALLDIKVIDPACGSGHFLLAAARRLAVELAQVRAGDDQPSEDDRQHALRDVVAHCIYAVDKNPMAVELCKVALWIEAIDPGKPLSFLDAHIQCGDSLVGVFDPKVLNEGIPDEAYKPLTGDNKTVCSSLKTDNARYRKTSRRGGGLQGSLVLGALQPRSHSQQELQDIEAMPETNLADSAAKQLAYTRWLADRGRDPESLAADLFTAAFFLAKTSDSRAMVPTTEHLLKLLTGQSIDEEMVQVVLQAAETFRFFHWHLRFGEAMEHGGFDCVLGNPPWERIKLQEKEFFAARSEAIATAPNKAARERLIKALSVADASEADRSLMEEFELAKREAEGSGEFIRGSGRFALTAVGDLNTYALFAEHFLRLIAPSGRSGVIVPTGIATDNSTKTYFDAISSGGRLVSLYDFENREAIFPGVHRSYKFALLTLGDGVGATDFVFFATATTQLVDQRRHFTLSADDIALINPNTRTCPVFRSQMDALLTRKMHSNCTILTNREVKSATSWDIRLATMLHKTNDASDLLETSTHVDNAGLLRVYEGKYGWIFDHRYATHFDSDFHAVPDSIKTQDYIISTELLCSQKRFESICENYENQGFTTAFGFLGHRRVSSSTNERTVVACIYPRLPSTYGWILSLCKDTADMALLCGAYNSLCFDYLLRNSLSQPSIPQGVFEQTAIPEAKVINHEFVISRVIELCFTASELKPWAEDLGYDGPPFDFDPERRALLRAELDAYYARLYGLTRDELRYILDPSDVMGPDYPSETFRVLKKNEIRDFGEYRTRRLVLEAWDRLFGGL